MFDPEWGYIQPTPRQIDSSGNRLDIFRSRPIVRAVTQERYIPHDPAIRNILPTERIAGRILCVNWLRLGGGKLHCEPNFTGMTEPVFFGNTLSVLGHDRDEKSASLRADAVVLATA